MKPLIVINGKPCLCKHFERCVIAIEQVPTSWTTTYKPGEQYALFWTRVGHRFIMHGAPRRTVRPSGRVMYEFSGEVYGYE